MSKGKYTRTTSKCRFEELNEEFKNQVKVFINDQKLTGFIEDVQICFSTTTEWKGFLGKKLSHQTSVLLTTEWMLWGVHGDKAESTGAAKLKDISAVKNSEDSTMYGFMEDSGIEITGFLFNKSHRATWFIGVGKENDATLLRETLKAIVT